MNFITGSTGFLGGALFLKLYKQLPADRFSLLIRANDLPHAKRRILDAFPSLRLAEEENQIFKRIHPILGNLTENQLGIDNYSQDLLKSECRTIYHSGANTNLALSYEESKIQNLYGTQNLLSLAKQISERSPTLSYNHISTAYVAGDVNKTVCSSSLDLTSRFRNGYEQAKAESEAEVLSYKDHFNVRIFRPSVIVGDSRTGKTSAFNVLYIPARVICAGVLKVIPALPYAPFDIVPIDYVVDAIVKAHNMSLQSGSTFHLTAGAGRESNPREIVDILLSTLKSHGSFKKIHMPTFAPPELLLKTLASVGSIANNIYQTPTFKHIEKLLGEHIPLLGQVLPLIPYMIANPRFDTSQTNAILKIDKAPKFEDYGEIIFRYCLDTKWGKVNPTFC